MEKIKTMECPVRLTVDQWAGVLRCLKEHHPDNKTIISAEKELRTQIDSAFEEQRNQLYEDVFGYDDPEADTQEIPKVNVAKIKFDDSILFVEDEPTEDFPIINCVLEQEFKQELEQDLEKDVDGLFFDEDESEDTIVYKYGNKDLIFMAFLCFSFLGFVTTMIA
jgi:hypothetical protein